MTNFPENAQEITERLASEAVMMDPKNIASLGAIMNLLDELAAACRRANQSVLVDLAVGIKGIIEKLVLNEHPDPAVGEDGIQQGLCLVQKALTEAGSAQGQDCSGEIRAFLSEITGTKTSINPSETGEGSDPSETESELQGGAAEEWNSQSVDLSQDRDILESFVMESLESLDTIEVNVLSLEQDPGNVEVMNAIFRPFHTIKGGAGFLNLREINHFAHEVETLLDDARSQRLMIDERITDLILDAVDLMKVMMGHVKESVEAGVVKDVDFGLDAFLDRLIDVRTGNQQDESIETTGENDGNCRTQTGEILVQKGLASKHDISSALGKQAESGQKLGEILMASKKVSARDMAGVLREQKKAQGSQSTRERKEVSQSFVKVDTQKLDSVVDMVGELVITEAMLGKDIERLASQDNKVYSTLSQLSRITSDLQRTSMSLRMVAIRQTFQKMTRLVRDLSKKSGKPVSLEMVGEDTEIDRTMVDDIYDPLVHMVRNAIDHGIEDLHARKAAGKSEKGRITLKAYHKGGNIVIQISEDGKGLDREKIIRRAVEKGLISSGTNMSDFEVHNLIFQPGFSTAETITDVSGRGVGMDVVKRSVENLRGKVEVVSEKGKGTTVLMKLPLTLAVIDGIMVRAGDRDFIIPTFSVLESLCPDKADCSKVIDQGEMIKIRDGLHPLVRLHEILGFEPRSRDPWDGVLVVAESDGNRKCILVDELLGKQEVVIKSLGCSLRNAKGMAGGAILADGRVGLILDMPGLFELSEN